MRTDVHAPASPDFDPEKYDCWGVFDTDPEWGDSKGRIETVNTLTGKGYRLGHGNSHQCGHCGTHIRYAALMVRQDVNEYIWVGQDCLSNRFEDLTKAEFDLLRKAGKLNRERATRREVRDQTFADNPWLLEVPTYGGDFLVSLHEQATAGKQLSERQVEAGKKALANARQREADFQAREAAKAELTAQGVKAPSGKVKVRGTVVKVKWHENAYGGSYKMIVEDQDGWKVWVTVPRSLEGRSALVNDEWVETPGVAEGDSVEFTADLTVSDRDPLFAFGKRPSKARILTTA